MNNDMDTVQLAAENEELRVRLFEAEDTLRAIRSGEVDALIVSGEDGDRLFSLKGADYSYRLLIEEMNEGALTITADGEILYANQRMAEMVRMPLEKVIGSVVSAWFAPDIQMMPESLLKEGCVNKYNVETVLTASDGALVPINLSACRLSMAGMPDYIGMVATDMTEINKHKQKEAEILIEHARLQGQLLDETESGYELLSVIEDLKQAEEQIRRLNEELEIKVQERTRQLVEAQEELVRKERLAVLGQVAGSVGHELRNPLGVMNNAVYFLQTVLPDADGIVKDYLGILRNEIGNSERIVSDLLDSVRTRPPHTEMVDVAELIAQTLGKYAVPANVTVQLIIPENLPPLKVDAMQIQQVLRNLISNGVEAMPEGGTLEISALENMQTVSVIVKDSGIGMTQEQLGHLFQPLFTTKARGIGLGMVVVKNLTEANGGRIEVRSEAGSGTTFTVTLPI